MKKITFYLQAASLLIISGSFFLSGCTHHLQFAQGRKFDTTNVKNIKKGITTKEEIVRMFDQPFSKNIGAANETWIYTYRLTAGNKSENSSLTLVFDKDIVKGCNFAYWSSSTPTHVTEPCGD